MTYPVGGATRTGQRQKDSMERAEWKIPLHWRTRGRVTEGGTLSWPDGPPSLTVENRDFEFRRLELLRAGAKVRVEKVTAAGWPV
jgi:hypothetical protein